MLKQYWMKLKARLTELMGFRVNRNDEIMKEILKIIHERKELRQNLEELHLQMKEVKDEAEEIYNEIKEMESAIELNDKKLLRLSEDLEEEEDVNTLYR